MHFSEYPHLDRGLTWLEEQFVRWRWWVLGLLAVTFFLTETLENLGPFHSHDTIEKGQIIFLVVLLVVGSLLMRTLSRAVEARNRAVRLLEQRYNLTIDFTRALDLDKAVDLIFDFTRSAIDLDGVALYLSHSQAGRFETVVRRGAVPPAKPGDEAGEGLSICPECPGDVCGLRPVGRSDVWLEPDIPGVCLPLVTGGREIGRLHFFFPAGRAPIPTQIDVVRRFTPEMAIALSSILQQRAQSIMMLDQARQEQRKSLSRDLHDTLGQSLATLRLNLELSARQIDKTPLPELKADLTRMCSAADDSLKVVRGTLAILQSERGVPLLNLLQEHGRLIAGRAKLAIAFAEEGNPGLFESETLRQIFYIFSESLANIEHHAQATAVDVVLQWGDRDFSLAIRDNGRGFDPHVTPVGDHFGIKFMRDRAAALNGHIEVESAPNQGTRLILKIPLPTSPDQNGPAST